MRVKVTSVSEGGFYGKQELDEKGSPKGDRPIVKVLLANLQREDESEAPYTCQWPIDPKEIGEFIPGTIKEITVGHVDPEKSN